MEGPGEWAPQDTCEVPCMDVNGVDGRNVSFRTAAFSGRS